MSKYKEKGERGRLMTISKHTSPGLPGEKETILLNEQRMEQEI